MAFPALGGRGTPVSSAAARQAQDQAARPLSAPPERGMWSATSYGTEEQDACMNSMH